MKLRIFLLTILALAAAVSLHAASGVLTYIEGDVTLETSDGAQRYAEIGDAVNVGDTLYTAKNALAEISLQGGSTVTIEAGSVFNVDEVAAPEIETRKRSFFRVVLGAVSFKFRGITDEPEVGTNLTVCSVRGTDFTVYSAPDGASLTVVSDGLVEVTSGGDSALLAAGAGVEALAGLGLGEPFEAKRGFVRYDEFAEEALNRIDEDPVKAIEGIYDTLIEFSNNGRVYKESWILSFDEMKKMADEVLQIKETEGDSAFEVARKQRLDPVQARTADLATTYRYYLISGLMLRRHVISNLYIRYRTKYLTESRNSDWISFKMAFDELLSEYENQLIPLLEEEDL